MPTYVGPSRVHALDVLLHAFKLVLGSLAIFGLELAQELGFVFVDCALELSNGVVDLLADVSNRVVDRLVGGLELRVLAFELFVLNSNVVRRLGKQVVGGGDGQRSRGRESDNDVA